MLFRSGITACPACDRPLDAVQDYLGVEVEKPAKSLPKAGFYHPACFDKLPEKPAYLRHFAIRTRRYLEQQRRYWEILETGDRFAAAYLPLTDSVRLYFLAQARTVDVRCPEPWEEFCAFLLDTPLRSRFRALAEQIQFSQQGRFALTQTNDPAVLQLGVRDGVTKKIVFSTADFAKLQTAAPACDRPGAHVDLAVACARAGLRPTLTDGRLETCRGVVIGAESGNGTVTLRLAAERWSKVTLSALEYTELCKLMERIA